MADLGPPKGPATPENLAGLDHLSSIAFNALSRGGACWSMWGTADCNGTPHACWAYRVFPHVCRCGNPDHVGSNTGSQPSSGVDRG